VCKGIDVWFVCICVVVTLIGKNVQMWRNLVDLCINFWDFCYGGE
jgi:hypothetical protein